MKAEIFDEIMRKAGLRVIGRGLACGSAGHFPVSVEVTNWMFGQVVFTYVLEGEKWKRAKTQIQIMVQSLKGRSAAGEDRIQITLYLKNERETSMPKVAKMIKEMDRILLENGEEPPCTCAVCKKEQADSFAIIGGVCQPVHKDCLQEQMNRIHAKSDINQSRGTYIGGIIGGILGLAAGIAPSVFSIYYTGKIYAAFFILIPICIYFGYRLLRGKLTKFAVGLTILLSIISIYVMNIVVVIMQYVLEERVTFHRAMELYLRKLQGIAAWGELTFNSDTMLCFLFVMIGIVIEWGQISRTNYSRIEEIDRVIDTVTGNPNVH